MPEILHVSSPQEINDLLLKNTNDTNNKRNVKVCYKQSGFCEPAIPDTDALFLCLDKLDNILLLEDGEFVRVGAGVTFRQLNQFLEQYQLMLSNQPNDLDLSIVGSFVYGFHGSGYRASISSQVRRIELVLPDGDGVITVPWREDLFHASAAGFGTTGVITSLEIGVTNNFCVLQACWRYTMPEFVEEFEQALFNRLKQPDNREVVFWNPLLNVYYDIQRTTTFQSFPQFKEKLNRQSDEWRRYLVDAAVSAATPTLQRFVDLDKRVITALTKMSSTSYLSRSDTDVATLIGYHKHVLEFFVPENQLVGVMRVLSVIFNVVSKSFKYDLMKGNHEYSDVIAWLKRPEVNMFSQLISTKWKANSFPTSLIMVQFCPEDASTLLGPGCDGNEFSVTIPKSAESQTEFFDYLAQLLIRLQCKLATARFQAISHWSATTIQQAASNFQKVESASKSLHYYNRQGIMMNNLIV